MSILPIEANVKQKPIFGLGWGRTSRLVGNLHRNSFRTLFSPTFFSIVVEKAGYFGSDMQNQTDKPFNWLTVATELKAISQAGRFFAKDQYELARHERLEWIAAQILERHSDLDADTIRAMLQQDCGYPTPKADCRGVVFKDDKVLLVKEIADGGWTLPGGWCDTGLTAAQNTEREVREESGYEVKAVRLLAVFDRDNQGHTPPYPFSIYKMFFLCEIIGGTAKASNETSEVAFFAEDQIPENLSTGRTLRHELKLFFRQYKDPNLPTAFD